MQKENKEELNKMMSVLKRMSNSKIEKILADISGITVEEKKKNKEISERSEKYKNLPIEQWPDFELLWDTSTKGYKFSFDGYNENNLKEYHPEGLCLGWVEFEELHKKLSPYCKREKDTIWEQGSTHKLAKAILHWVDKNLMSPVLISHKDNTITIGGGYHRYAVCIVKNPKSIPVLVTTSDKVDVNKILNTIVWDSS